MQNVSLATNYNVNANIQKPLPKQENANAPKKYAKEEENPISRRGEAFSKLSVIFGSSILIGAWIFAKAVSEFELNPFGIVQYFEKFRTKEVETDATKIKNNLAKYQNNKVLKEFGFAAAIFAGLISGFALLCTLLATPRVVYKSKVDAYRKGKEMDVYIKGNNAEKELYEQIDQRAKNNIDKEELKQEYLQLKMAKNKVPDFVYTEGKIKNNDKGKTPKTPL